MHSIVINTVVLPHFVFEVRDTQKTLQTASTFNEVLTLVNDMEISSDSKLFINRGPGSYSGIRTGMAYGLGITQGKLIQKENLAYYTTFDLLATDQNVFLKAWPRIGGTLETIKGYYFDRKAQDISYRELSSLTESSIILLEATEELNLPKELHTIYTQDIITKENLTQFLEKTTFTAAMEPLYINPVNITR